ncbi:hypothetical protein TRIP_B330573 [uncultured Desulfatiglans sp.]|nr:hypothetical protein TRIP_B330573 [uncultured Desulfatiglans sp.]
MTKVISNVYKLIGRSIMDTFISYVKQVVYNGDY